MRTIKFYTLGCKVNQYETESIREQFIRAGFKELENSWPADVYVINTCTVTHRADVESLNLIRQAKRENPRGFVVVTGCLTELDSDRIKEIGGINLIVRNKDKGRIFEHSVLLNRQTDKWFDKLTIPRTLSTGSRLLRRMILSLSKGIPSEPIRLRLRVVPSLSKDEPIRLRLRVVLGLSKDEVEGQANRQTKEGISYFKGHTRAFLKIQDGCNNFCSYCKVPLVRGKPQSKSINDIIQEANALVKNGFKEIVLCGICLGSYGKDLNSKISLVDAIEVLEKIEGLLRIRLSSIEAMDVSEALIDKMVQSKKLCPHLHIPMQSGDDDILKKMNRHYTSADYIGLIKKIRTKIPSVAITTDVLVGFPGETEENFQNTVEAIKEILPLKVHIFPYSQREGTAAANFENKLSPKIIKERIGYLKNIAQECALKYKSYFLNKDMDVLIESRSKDNLTFWQGYTNNYIVVWVKSSKNFKNRLIPLRLKRIVNDYVLADDWVRF